MPALRRFLRSRSIAERTGLLSLTAALALAWIDIRLAAVPFTGLLILCLAAPFFPGFGFFLPVVSRGSRKGRELALTFDDGPDPVTTPLLLALLSRHRAAATFFITGERAAAYPHLIRAILQGGHQVGNHSFSHDNLIMLKSRARLEREISAAQAVLSGLAGIRPLALRPPVGIVSPRLSEVLEGTGIYVLNFSLRAGDFGNRRLNGLSRRILKRVRPGDIVLLHDARPLDPSDLKIWDREMDRMLAGIKRKGLRVVPLPDLIGRPVMAQGR